jgi:hypothetical protein
MEGRQTDDPSGFIMASHTHGQRTTLFCKAIVQPPNPMPTLIVDKYPSYFNLDPTLSDDGVKENTLSTWPSDSGGVPDTTTDPPNLTSFQAIVDNILGNPDLNDDPSSLCIRDFTSTTSKILDGAIHEFCHKLMCVDRIIQDLQADHINPKSFVSTQVFNYRIQNRTT